MATTTESGSPTPDSPRPVHAGGVRAVLDELAAGDPGQHLALADLLGNLRQTGFGLFLMICVLPAFLPIPGVAGGLSGPLVVLVGLQLLVGLQRPWLPDFLARRGPNRSTIVRFRSKFSRLLGWLEWLVRPRLHWVLEHRLANAVTGLLLVLLGILLSLPIPFTNYVFGALLLAYAFALLERDGALMLLAWLAGIIAIVVFGAASGSLLEWATMLLRKWF
ncbi:MAG: exopolysaccharide biosynthesis protein [Pseudoxanthomonas sp.]